MASAAGTAANMERLSKIESRRRIQIEFRSNSDRFVDRGLGMTDGHDHDLRSTGRARLVTSGLAILEADREQRWQQGMAGSRKANLAETRGLRTFNTT